MALNTPQRSLAPRRTGVTILSIVSLLVLGTFLAANLSGPAKKDKADSEWTAHTKSSSSNARAETKGDKYLIGVGKADITGPSGMYLPKP